MKKESFTTDFTEIKKCTINSFTPTNLITEKKWTNSQKQTSYQNRRYRKSEYA